MLRFLLIVFGGGTGSLLRHLLSGFAYNKLSSNIFPTGTLVVNVIGAICAGVAWAIMERVSISHNVRIFVFVGFLGGFTTFSTYTLESFNLLRDGEIRLAMLNIFCSNILCLGLIFAGFFATRYFVSSIK